MELMTSIMHCTKTQPSQPRVNSTYITSTRTITNSRHCVLQGIREPASALQSIYCPTGKGLNGPRLDTIPCSRGFALNCSKRGTEEPTKSHARMIMHSTTCPTGKRRERPLSRQKTPYDQFCPTAFSSLLCPARIWQVASLITPHTEQVMQLVPFSRVFMLVLLHIVCPHKRRVAFLDSFASQISNRL